MSAISICHQPYVHMSLVEFVIPSISRILYFKTVVIPGSMLATVDNIKYLEHCFTNSASY